MNSTAALVFFVSVGLMGSSKIKKNLLGSSGRVAKGRATMTINTVCADFRNNNNIMKTFNGKYAEGRAFGYAVKLIEKIEGRSMTEAEKIELKEENFFQTANLAMCIENSELVENIGFIL